MVADVLTDYAKKKPLFVTDELLSKMPICTDFIEELKHSGLDLVVFSDIVGNPLRSQVNKGAKIYTAKQCDSIIAFGGGAAIDVAKCIGVEATHPEDLLSYEDVPGANTIDDQKLPPVFALPTTAGTGSEVGRSAVVSDDKTKIKKIIFSPGMLPRAVFLDPQLHLALPPQITATTGMDALTHCIEAYLVNIEHPMCDGIALEGIHLVSRSLPKAVEFASNPKSADVTEHLNARGEMLNAAMMGSVAFQKGLGVNHSCAHSLSTVGNLHHGLANAIMLPHVLLFNFKGHAYKFSRMAEAAGCGNDGMKLIKWVSGLNQKIGIPESLLDVGIKRDDVKRLTEIAQNDVCHLSNPRKVTKEDFDMLFRSAF